MTDSTGQRHVYLRQMAAGERTTLSIMAGWIAPGSRVLDLGTGSGALGAWLTRERGCTVDGLTINEEEAQLARDGYRRIEVADLQQPSWVDRFAGEQYDAIVCADVLEHLPEPERVLAACRALLAPEGQLLVSVPNAAYSGLVAELMVGEFRYRPEGLLDRTHLRFFTRSSLAEFLTGEGYGLESLEGVQRPLAESEFRVRFDDLPPAVARYLENVPDGDTYQLVARARPGRASTANPAAAPARAHTSFVAQVFWATEAGYSEQRSVSARGAIGVERQWLRFAVPAGAQRLRFDPADRPGFLRLHGMRLVAGEQVRWAWRADSDGTGAFDGCARQQLLLDQPWPASPGLVLSHGDDPWLELPVTAEALAGDDLALEVELDWPMSADYFALAGAVRPLADRVDALQGEVNAARGRAEQLQADLAAMSGRAEAGEAQLAAHRHRLAEAQEEMAALKAQAAAALAETAAALADTRVERDRLQEQAALARQRQTQHSIEVRKLTQEKMAVQRELAGLQQQFQQLAQHLRWIENSTVFRATRPLVHAKMAVDRWLGRTPPAGPAPAAREEPAQPLAPTVDVIVPVYRGLEDTRCCIESILASACRTPWRLVVLNDASPEPEVTAWLRDVASREPRILLLENEQNLGFVGTVNRGMALSDAHDVVLVNSDAEVANDWLDRLRAAAYRDARVASVTPFSNNATICSYPKFCAANELPPGWSTAQLDRAFARANPGEVLDVPTGVGFCMYIRRDCLREVGLFDVEQFGKGYGEENDFCRRAADAGWRNLHALDTFVRHAGGVSFGESKSQREIEAVEKLRRLHPSYEPIVHAYVQADPPRDARLKADIARVALAAKPVVLAVLHNRGGGTHRHVVELADHLRDQVVFFALAPAAGGGLTLELLESGSTFRLAFQLPQDWDALLDTLRSIGVAHVHYHHVIGHHDLVLHLGEQLGVSYDYTTHDFFPMCPNISLTDQSDRFCGEEGDASCHRCASGTPDGNLPGWRERYGGLLAGARAVLSPSRDAARRFTRMWPAIPVRFAPHPDLAPERLPQPQVQPLPEGRPLRIAVLGALSRIKGADVLEDVAAAASRSGSPLEFHLLGFAYRNLKTQPHAALTVHGAYADEDLPRLLAWLRPDVVWFPAQWPETYSYTLSACLEAGLPVVAPELGAFRERLNGRAWSWLQPWDQPAPEWLAFFTRIRDEHFATGKSPARAIAAVSAAESQLPVWEHQRDYARGLPVLDVASLPPAVLRHAIAPGQQVAGEAAGLKRAALSSLVRLRSTPGFRHLARAIPAHVQRRLKNWLLA